MCHVLNYDLKNEKRASCSEANNSTLRMRRDKYSDLLSLMRESSFSLARIIYSRHARSSRKAEVEKIRLYEVPP